jgi:lysylphosphatidylglycerol synthetase-like protein (DUF2156 family)
MKGWIAATKVAGEIFVKSSNFFLSGRKLKRVRKKEVS